jgi:hypothetical protein
MEIGGNRGKSGDFRGKSGKKKEILSLDSELFIGGKKASRYPVKKTVLTSVYQCLKKL